ncbi:hypothetical protein AMECASPLE_026147 [Ameca splendens]|uniref:Uncharacterized protein n=1 Tax=Ameca splendens TaxID=208324 RepID=A0ABV0Z3N2_9TELE
MLALMDLNCLLQVLAGCLNIRDPVSYISCLPYIFYLYVVLLGLYSIVATSCVNHVCAECECKREKMKKTAKTPHSLRHNCSYCSGTIIRADMELGLDTKRS